VRELIEGAKGSPTKAVADIPRPAAVIAPPKPLDLPGRDEPEAIAEDLMHLGDPDLAQRSDNVPQIEDLPTASPVMMADSLDDYFDKLDEAFATINPGNPAHAVSSLEPAAPHQDGSVLDQDLDPFDTPAFATAASNHAEALDPFAAIDALPIEESLRVPTLDDLLAGMPPAPQHNTVIDFPTSPRPVAAASAAVLEAPGVASPAPSAAPAPAVPSPVLTAPLPQPEVPSPGRSIIADAFSALLAVEQGEPGAVAPRLGGNGAAPVMTDAMIDDVARRVVQKLALGSSDEMQTIVRDVVSSVSERLVREEIDRIRRNVPRS
jgi:hypothetical protein